MNLLLIFGRQPCSAPDVANSQFFVLGGNREEIEKKSVDISLVMCHSICMPANVGCAHSEKCAYLM